MFHIGHLNLLRRAKERCDYLIVGVSTDAVVMSYKKKHPLVPFEQRLSIVNSIRYVDEVCAQEDMDKFKAWQNIHFNVMFHGNDWKGSDLFNKYEEQFSKIGVGIEYLPTTKGISSSSLRILVNTK